MFDFNRKRLRITLVVTIAVALAACSGESEESSAADDLAQVIDFTPIVSATGEVVPAQWATISSPAAGFISELLVAKGDMVEAGQVLARIGNEQALQAAVAAASLELVAVQQVLDDIHTEAGMRAAQAQLELANARDALREAGRKWQFQQEGQRGSSTTVRAAEAELALAKEAMDHAERNADKFSSDDSEHAQDYKNYAAAVQRYRTALASVNWYKGHPTELQQSLLDAEVAKAAADVEALEQLWEKVREGPDPDVLAVAEAMLKLAEAQLASAQEAAQNGVILAPFDGIVAELTATPGETAVLGQALVVVADLDHLQVETSDLSERDIDRVSVGLPAEVFIEPLGIAVPGRVVRIASSATTIGGDVVYAVTLDLEELPDGVLWGMSAEVEIGVE